MNLKGKNAEAVGMGTCRALLSSMNFRAGAPVPHLLPGQNMRSLSLPPSTLRGSSLSEWANEKEPLGEGSGSFTRLQVTWRER